MAISLHDNYQEAHLLLGSILAGSQKKNLLSQVPCFCLCHGYDALLVLLHCVYGHEYVIGEQRSVVPSS